MAKPVFIYALCEPETRAIRYIGQTYRMEKRFKEHLKCSIKKKSNLGRWLRKIISEGGRPHLLELCQVSPDIRDAAEMVFIRLAREMGNELVNANDGGGGRNPHLETRAKMSVAKKGVPLSPTHRAAMSAASKGVSKTLAHRAAISAAHLGVKIKPRSPEQRAAQSARQKGVPRGPYSPKALGPK